MFCNKNILRRSFSQKRQCPIHKHPAAERAGFQSRALLSEVNASPTKTERQPRNTKIESGTRGILNIRDNRPALRNIRIRQFCLTELFLITNSNIATRPSFSDKLQSKKRGRAFVWISRRISLCKTRSPSESRTPKAVAPRTETARWYSTGSWSTSLGLNLHPHATRGKGWFVLRGPVARGNR